MLKIFHEIYTVRKNENQYFLSISVLTVIDPIILIIPSVHNTHSWNDYDRTYLLLYNKRMLNALHFFSFSCPCLGESCTMPNISLQLYHYALHKQKILSSTFWTSHRSNTSWLWIFSIILMGVIRKFWLYKNIWSHCFGIFQSKNNLNNLLKKS